MSLMITGVAALPPVRPREGTRPAAYVYTPAPAKELSADEKLLRMIADEKGDLWIGFENGVWALNRGYVKEKETILTFSKNATRDGVDTVRKAIQRLMLDALEVGYNTGYDDGYTDGETDCLKAFDDADATVASGEVTDAEIVVDE